MGATRLAEPRSYSLVRSVSMGRARTTLPLGLVPVATGRGAHVAGATGSSRVARERLDQAMERTGIEPLTSGLHIQSRVGLGRSGEVGCPQLSEITPPPRSPSLNPSIEGNASHNTGFLVR